MAGLPILRLTLPASLVGAPNGRLPAGSLRTLPNHNGGADVTLHPLAARAWLALTAAALADGHTLKTSHPNSSYRPYADQERIFRARYYPSPFGTRFWLGQLWRKRAGVAAAAVPGTSNHGLGLAVDTGHETDGDPGVESIGGAGLAWLIGNAHRFGFSAELQSEPWHWRYVAGDQLPPEVLKFEAGTVPALTEGNDPMKLINDPELRRMWAVFQVDGTTTVREYSSYRGEQFGDPIPGIGYVIDQQITAGTIRRAT